MDRKLTGAEFAARRHLIGLTLDELAAALGVNPRTTRAWESGRDRVPARIGGELSALIAEHTALVDRLLDAGAPVVIPWNRAARVAGRPRGWFVAAVARAVAVEPDVEADWS